MPAAYTPQQRSAIQQFVNFTQVKDSAAAKVLKAANWDINVALNSHYAKGSKSQPPSQGPALGGVFDQFRQPDDEPDAIGIEGQFKYFETIGVSPEEPAAVAVMSVTGTEAIGEMVRSKFVSGWEAYSPTINSTQGMQAAADNMRAQLQSDPAFFKTVYKHGFLLARHSGQRSADLENAVAFWQLLFGEQGLYWRTANVKWLDLWVQFVKEGSMKVVSRDVWNQLESFARKTLEDETLGFWSEESSWPTAIDDFVAYAKKANGASTQMEL